MYAVLCAYLPLFCKLKLFRNQNLNNVNTNQLGEESQGDLIVHYCKSSQNEVADLYMDQTSLEHGNWLLEGEGPVSDEEQLRGLGMSDQKKKPGGREGA